MYLRLNQYKKKRLLAGRKVKDAATELGISKSYVWAIENGSRKPGRDLLIRMAEVYNCNITDFLYEEDNTKRVV